MLMLIGRGNRAESPQGHPHVQDPRPRRRRPQVLQERRQDLRFRRRPSAAPLLPRHQATTHLKAYSSSLVYDWGRLQWVGIRTGLPLPSAWEVAAQLGVYFVVEDYFNYWLHRALHCRWGYEHVHRVHHEFTAPVGFAAPYAHWAEVLILGLPAFIGPAIAPGHILTFWLWFVLRHIEAIETRCGYDFPGTPTKYIPFYGGAEYHDYHHYVGGKSHSNFASVFIYCDYIYGTDKGYRYHKAQPVKLREQKDADEQYGETTDMSGKRD